MHVLMLPREAPVDLISREPGVLNVFEAAFKDAVVATTDPGFLDSLRQSKGIKDAADESDSARTTPIPAMKVRRL